MNRTITYAIDLDSGMVVSRVGSDLAWPVLDFEAIGKGGDGFEPGNFNGPTRYNLQNFPVLGTPGWDRLRWTKKIPVATKNLHRKFWSMKPLPEPVTA